MNKILLCGSTIFLFLMLTIIGCQKENAPISENSIEQTFKSKSIIIDGSNRAKSANGMTVLGKKRVNPYTVANMTAAWNQLYPEHQQTALPATDLYVRFSPKTFQELADLQTAIYSYDVVNNDINENDPFLYDYPLEYEIEQIGDYYHDPKIPSGEITYHYAVVKPNFQFPTGISYKIIDELVLAPYNSFLTAEAFRRTNNAYYNSNGEQVVFCESTCPNYPACLADDVDCEGGEVYPLPLPCLPGAAHWPFCLGLHRTSPSSPVGPTPVGGGTSTNSCGCPIFNDVLMPSGCVQVEDTQLGFEGVKSVQVYIRDRWFMGRSSWTTNDGCWSIEAPYWGGIQGQVVWRNSRATIRGIMGVDLVQYGLPVTQELGTHVFAPFNDFQIRHHRFSDNGDIRRLHWYASTAMNSLFEYDFYAQQEGIGAAASELQILLANHDGSAAAPMFYKLQQGGVGFTVSQVIGNTAVLSLTPILEGFLPGFGVITTGLATYFVANLPDVVYAYGDDGMRTSDVVKETFYHEYGHTAHYAGLPFVTRDQFWFDNIARTLDNSTSGSNPPYGVKNTPGAERTAIIESWAGHIGSFMADLQYGVNNRKSRLHPSDPNMQQINRYIYRYLEIGEDVPSADRWIPYGIFWDLIDDRSHNGAPLNIVDPETDFVEGVTNAQIFNAIITNAPTTIQPIRDAIKVNHPTIATDIDNLFLDYGY
ncbi:hypothetical protein [Aureispira sp. CCB-E]|uniref:hypothetical protein n=1 Tax=Aureispira sp. CCB-E TaxID=3051121 RepID=UPI00286974AC|nr:hypothetical protein [Aureispira sp. CCB-E]WMX17030.1 hypothetical protein QP953_11670 [Aureispira sp. CCB-E]